MGCFNGKLPCKDDKHDIFINPGEGGVAGGAGGGAGGSAGAGDEDIETK